MPDNKKVTPPTHGEVKPQPESGAKFFKKVVQRTDVRNILTRLAK